jgi:uncharacterized protein (DUF1778 family)
MKDDRLFIRVSREDKEVIASGANKEKSTLSEFTVKAAIEKAGRILKRKRDPGKVK